MSFDRKPHDVGHQPGLQPGVQPGGESPSAVGKRTLTGVPTQPDRERHDKWTTIFRGLPSRPVNVLARVAVRKGVKVLEEPAGESQGVAPLNELVQIERTTTESNVAQRWAYIVAPSAGLAGFVEERFLMWDPPEPSAKVHRVVENETMISIINDAYPGRIGTNHDLRMYCHALYLANRNVAGVVLESVDLSRVDTFLREQKEEETLRIFLGVHVLKDHAIWIPSDEFVGRLRANGEITSGRTTISQAWDATKDAVEHVLDDAKFGAGVMIGVLDGAFLAVRDLVGGAAQMIEALFRALTADIAGLVRIGKEWIGDFETLWKQRGQIVGDFMAKWNQPDDFGRGKFRGEVVGWLLANVAIIILTAGEASPGVLGAIATRFPQAVADLRLISDLGEVTTYTSAIGRGLELPANVQRHLDKRIPSGVQVANQARGHARFRDQWNDAAKIRSIVATSRTVGHPSRLYEFRAASTDELQSLADVLHDTRAWVLGDTIKLSPKGIQALQLAVRDSAPGKFSSALTGGTSHAFAFVDHDVLGIVSRD